MKFASATAADRADFDDDGADVGTKKVEVHGYSRHDRDSDRREEVGSKIVFQEVETTESLPQVTPSGRQPQEFSPYPNCGQTKTEKYRILRVSALFGQDPCKSHSQAV